MSPPEFRKPVQRCQCCERSVALTFHHLIPRKIHRRKRFKSTFSKDELNRGVYVCRVCHVGIHRIYDELTLAKHFHTLDLLKADAALAQHFAWAAKQKERRGSPDWI